MLFLVKSGLVEYEPLQAYFIADGETALPAIGSARFPGFVQSNARRIGADALMKFLGSTIVSGYNMRLLQTRVVGGLVEYICGAAKKIVAFGKCKKMISGTY